MHNGGDVQDLTAWARAENRRTLRESSDRGRLDVETDDRMSWEDLDKLPRPWTWDAVARRWVPPAK